VNVNLFESETGRSLRAIPGVYVHKFPDTHAFRGFGYCPNCEAKLKSKFPQEIILQKQPSDWLAVRNGKAYFIECKSTRNTVSYNITWIAEHQISDALEIEKAGGIYYFVLCRRKPLDMDAWVLLPKDILDIKKNMTTKAAVRWHVIEEVGYSLERDTKEKRWLGWETMLI
jgi:penicillin-binding protein-related factor A (putative recombinase)